MSPKPAVNSGSPVLKLMLLTLLVGAGGTATGRAAGPGTAPPLPAPTGTVVNVATEAQLQSAMGNLSSGTTVVIAAGTYQLTSTLYLNGSLANVTIRGATNNPADVVLVGRGMGNSDFGNVPHGVWTGGGVTGFTLANLTIRDVYYHPVIMNAGTESPRLYNLRLIDAGEQFVKANPDGSGGGVDNGIVEYSLLAYTTAARSTYTNGVDVHGGRNWIIRHNRFERLRSSSGLAGPAILMWNNSSDTIADSNTFLDCHREISFGLNPRAGNDHRGGIIRNNMIVRSAGSGGDVAIAAFDSPSTKILHNTVLMGGTYPNAIEYRFNTSSGMVVVNNLVDAAITARDGASGSVQGNITTADSGLFVSAATGDLHLKATSTAAINKGATVSDAQLDWDGQDRSTQGVFDVGADEYVGAAPPAPPRNLRIISS